MSGYVPLSERPQGGHARVRGLALEMGPGPVLDVDCSFASLAGPLVATGTPSPGVEPAPRTAEARNVLCDRVVARDVESPELLLDGDLGTTRNETVASLGYYIVESELSAPVPIIRSPTVERVAHVVASLQPSPSAYELFLAANPR